MYKKKECFNGEKILFQLLLVLNKVGVLLSSIGSSTWWSVIVKITQILLIVKFLNIIEKGRILFLKSTCSNTFQNKNNILIYLKDDNLGYTLELLFKFFLLNN